MGQAMVTGKVVKGVVVLDSGARLREGTLVRVEPLGSGDAGRGPVLAKGTRSSVGARLLKFAGRLRGPPDWAERHDYYRREGQRSDS
jgi:hypothetical protein